MHYYTFMNIYRFSAILAASVINVGILLATPSIIINSEIAAINADDGGQFRHALSLFEKGQYAEAKALFDGIDRPDAQSEGYGVLCAVKMKTADYPVLVKGYTAKYPYSGLATKINLNYAYNLFDEGDFAAAERLLNKMDETDVDKDGRAEYIYKKSYCQFYNGDYESASEGFKTVDGMPQNDFKAPSQYALGYINYEQKQFPTALKWFEKSQKDYRFKDVSNYYIMECRFMMKDYDYVIEHGDEVYDNIPENRKQHLARIISESWLVKGNTAKAKEYYEDIKDASGKTRGDYFYAGTLLYATKDWKGAIENYSKMTDRTDSIGQLANYQMAYSYIQTKNKVAAMDSFKDAAAVKWDKEIQEDSWLNYAKLAFDLNKDGSAFEEYMAKYPNKKKNDEIYGYIALAALYNRDYAGALEAYDNIDELNSKMTGNYMKANYLRGGQLAENGAWRDAAPCFKTASWYAPAGSAVKQLSDYWMAESYFRDEQYENARKTFANLYNTSALDGRDEGYLMPYNVAYCYFKEGNYAQASKWFDTYLKSKKTTQRKDALLRKADCDFSNKAYSDAISAYSSVIKEYPAKDDLYPYYQSGVAYGLLGDNAKKIEVLSAASSASKNANYYDETMYELGKAYLTAEKNDDAEKIFANLAKSGNNSSTIAKALIGQGLASRNKQQYDKALGYYKQVVKNYPNTEYSQDALQAIESIYQVKQEPENYLAYVESIGNLSGKTEAEMEEILYNSSEQVYLTGNWEKALTSLKAYESKYPKGSHIDDVNFYIAESYRGLDKTQQACDYYKKVLGTKSDYVESAALQYARLSYKLQHYDDALSGYKSLASVAKIAQNKQTAAVGLMESAYQAKKYSDAIKYADALSTKDKDLQREAKYIKAKSLLASSKRTEAMKIMKELSSQKNTAEGAEAAYMLIQDNYDQGNFSEVKKMVQSFAKSGSNQSYWMAKSFLLLGDTYVEEEEYKQARATFESVRDGYDGDDDVTDAVKMRLSKLSEMGK